MRKLKLKADRLTALDAADLLGVSGAASGVTCVRESALIPCESARLQCNTQLECALTAQGCMTGSGCG